MQVHCRRSLITLMLDGPCQGDSMRSTILVGRFPGVLAYCTRLARCGVGWQAPRFAALFRHTAWLPMLRASCRAFCKQAATTRSRLPPPLR
jgi:hypothetical protein